MGVFNKEYDCEDNGNEEERFEMWNLGSKGDIVIKEIVKIVRLWVREIMCKGC